MIALVSTGGTIAMVGRHPYDWVDYAESKVVRGPDEIVAELAPLLPKIPIEIIPVRGIGSTGITLADWRALHDVVSKLVERTEITGVVITHGTATLEETAWFLALTLTTEKPVVLVGAQRPPNTAGSDAGPNLRAALLVAQSDAARGLGVLVAMGGRVFDARSVTKLSNHDLAAFDGGDSGALGRVTSNGRVILRHRPQPLPLERPWRLSPDTELPRVDIAFSYAGADGTAVRSFVAAGAKGIVSAGLPPGRPANEERKALVAAANSGVIVVLASRALRGPVEPASDAARDGFLTASDLGALKTRILLALALSVTAERTVLAEILDRF